MKTRRTILASALLSLGAIALVPTAHALTPAELANGAAGFSAKEACSCRFVVGQSPDYCRTYGQPPVPGLTATVQIDDAARTVTSSVGFAGATATRVARMTEKNGCVLDRP